MVVLEVEVKAQILLSEDELSQDGMGRFIPFRQLGQSLAITRQVACHKANRCVVDLKRQSNTAFVLRLRHEKIPSRGGDLRVGLRGEYTPCDRWIRKQMGQMSESFHRKRKARANRSPLPRAE